MNFCYFWFVYRNVVIYVFGLVSLALRGQAYRHFTVEDGLPSNRIYKVLQDSTGFIWMATDNGLVRFDGKHFYVFNTSNGLPVNDVWEMELDGKNRLWYITNASGLGFIKDDSVHVYYLSENNGFVPIHHNLSDTIVGIKSGKFFYVWNGKKWYKSASKYSGINYPLIHTKYLGLNYKRYEKRADFYLLTRQNDTIDLNINATILPAVFRQISKDLFFISTPGQIVISRLDSLHVRKIRVDSLFDGMPRAILDGNKIQWTQGNTWMLTDKNGNIESYRRFGHVDEAHGVFRDRSGNFWVYTFGKGIWFFPKTNGKTSHYFVDRKVHFTKMVQNNIYVHILDEGVFRWNRTSSGFDKILDYPGYVYDIFHGPDSTLWVLGSTQLYVFSVHDWLGKDTWFGNAGIARGPNILFSKKNIVIERDKNLQNIDTINLSNTVLFRHTPLGLLAGTNRGLYRIQANRAEQLFKNRLFNVSVKDIFVWKNHTYVLTEAKGLFRISPAGVLQKMEIAGLTGKIDVAALDSSGNLWLSNGKGLAVYGKDKDQKFRFRYAFHKMHGLTSEQVTGIVFDNADVWVSSYNGVVRFPASKIPAPELEHLYLRFVEYNGKKIRDKAWKFHRHSRLRIGFGLVDFMHPHYVQLYYRMMPGGQWHRATSDELSFEGMRPGSYRFELRALGPGGTHKQLTYNFSIMPLWWQTATARSLMILALAFLLLFTGSWIRKKRLQRKHEQLIREKQWAEAELASLRSRMNPHFIFNALNGILYHIEKQEYRISEKYLVKFSRLVRKIFELSAVKTISLEKEVQFITDYLEVEKIRFKDRLSYCMDIAPEVSMKEKIPSMLLQPLVENALQHGLFHKQGKGHICVEIRKLGASGLLIRVKDDGIGIKKAGALKKRSSGRHLSRATRIINNRIELINRSRKWKIEMWLSDETGNPREPYNTVVTLKIMSYDQSYHY